MLKSTSKLIDELQAELKKENVGLFLVTIENGKENIITISPEELNLEDDKHEEEKKIFNKYLQSALNFNRKDYE